MKHWQRLTVTMPVDWKYQSSNSKFQTNPKLQYPKLNDRNSQNGSNDNNGINDSNENNDISENNEINDNNDPFRA